LLFGPGFVLVIALVYVYRIFYSHGQSDEFPYTTIEDDLDEQGTELTGTGTEYSGGSGGESHLRF
jgi:hypothetical protein